MYPTFKKCQGKQSIQYSQNVKVLSNCEIKFPGKLGTINAKIHRDIEGKVKTVTISKNPDGRYFASIRHFYLCPQPTASEIELNPAASNFLSNPWRIRRTIQGPS